MYERSQAGLDRRAVLALTAAAPVLGVGAAAQGQPTSATPPERMPAAPVLRDGAGDFDFLMGDWKAHVWRMPDRLVGSDKWIEYEGTSSHHKLFGGPGHMEEFKVTSLDPRVRPNGRPEDGLQTAPIHGQTLRLYNRQTRQWSIYLVDVAEGTIGLPPMTGDFTRGHGEFYDTEPWKDRLVIVRFQWFDLGPKACRMEQAFSADGGRSWETNWVCECRR
jgi:hypothetical protein